MSLEVNQYYTDQKPRIRRWSHSAALFEMARHAKSIGVVWLYRAAAALVFVRERAPILFVPGLFAAGWLVWLRTRWLVRRLAAPADITTLLVHMDDFAAQYPLNPYAIVSRCTHLPFLREHVGGPRPAEATIVDLAAGEGSYSNRVFDRPASVVAVDVNPVSLSKAAERRYCRIAIVGDAMDPPFTEGAADVMVCNNLVMHVSDKARVLGRWARLTRVIAYNDVTPNVGRTLPGPRLLGAIGLRRLADSLGDAIAKGGAAQPVDRTAIDALAAQTGRVVASTSYLSPPVHFLCGVMSMLMMHQGPTPDELRRVLQRWPFAGITARLSRALGQTLLLLDRSATDRSADAFVAYVVATGATRRADGALFRCPDCRSPLAAPTECRSCGRTFTARGGLTFMLPSAMSYVEQSFDERIASAAPADHL